jgi:hypothetical protein
MEPEKVINSYISNMDNQNEVDIKFVWNIEESSLTLHDFYIPVDSGLFYMQPVTIFEVVWQ